MSEDSELAAIRAARLAQLKSQAGAGSTPSGLGRGGGDEGGADPEEAAQQRKQEEQMRRDILATVLDPAARERLSRIALVRPQLSGQIEGILMRMATSGQLRGRVSEQQLIGLLEQAEEAQSKSAPKKTIVYQRRKELDDDNDDFDI